MEKKYPIKYMPSAEQDLTDIYDYVFLDDPVAAGNLLNQFDESISILAHFPYSCISPSDIRLQSLNYRILVVGNYLVFYAVIEDSVEIRRIFHGKRKYDFLI
jgi:toxin ParE1/3/4